MNRYMEGSVLNFLKAEWKVSDTGSAHWASSLISYKSWQLIKCVYSFKHIAVLQTNTNKMSILRILWAFSLIW
jgi:hypothetical protein